VHAVLIAGGSAFGLAAADGVVRWLEERGVGFDAGPVRVPIVPAAVLFDLGVGDPAVRPGPAEGYAACEAASDAVPEGNVGAGTGATVAKLRGPEGAVKGGVGSASRRVGELVVGAIAAVNALGEVVEDDGTVIAGSRIPEGAADATEPPDANTTLVVVATNARLSKERAHLLALAAHQGLSLAVRPSHTLRDGDTAFALATGEAEAAQRDVERLAEPVVAEAIRRAVRAAEGVPGVPAAAR
jgi:L-aminopeptidase/D-esterase-like protein